MNEDISDLKEYIKSQYSIDNLKSIWEHINIYKSRIQQLNTNLQKSKLDPEVEQSIHESFKLTESYIINLQNQFNNIIANSSGRNLMIFFNDGSRFIINSYILNYMANHNYITEELLLLLVEDNDIRDTSNFFEKIKKTGNKIIQQLIGISEHQIILNDICLDSRNCIFNSANYLLDENKLKMLLIEFSHLNKSYGQTVDFNKISLLYKSITFSPRIIIHTLQEFINKSRCCFMFVIKTAHAVFGWILETTSRHFHIQKQKIRVLLLFKIIGDVLYTFESTDFFYFFYANANSNSGESPYISLIEEKYNDSSLSDDTLGEIGDIIDILRAFDDEITLSVDQNFGNKTLDYFDRKHIINIQQIQIYDILGQITDNMLLEIITPSLNSQVFITEQTPRRIIKKFNYTIETIKQIYKQITKIDTVIDEQQCDNKFCPIYHPYLCAKESNFRNNFVTDFFGKIKNRGHSKGNNAPCVPEKRFCDMAYLAATTVMDTENISMGTLASRKYSSKPIYCKIDQTEENKQEYNSEGGKYTLSKNRIRKTSKNQKKSRNQKKRSKNQKRSKRNY
jgi:hypothetical protein